MSLRTGRRSDSAKARVVLLVPIFPRVSETFVVRLFLGLVDRGWDVHVLCRASSGFAGFPELTGRTDLQQRIHVVSHTESRAGKILGLVARSLTCSVRAPWRTVKYVFRGWRTAGRSVATDFYRDAELVRLGPDIVHFQFGVDAVGREWLAELLDCALVVTFQGYDINLAGIEQDPGFYSELWRRADGIHLVSEASKARAERRGMPSDSPSHVVLNGVDVQHFDPGTREHVDVAGIPDRPLRILGVGRLHWTKGYEYALMAVRRLIEMGVHCEFRVVGDGELLRALLFTAQDLGVEAVVSFAGAQDRSAVREHMLWADALMHAAVSESFCLVVAEAQAMRLPVVVTDAGGLPENVADGHTGYVVPRRDPSVLGERLAELARDPALRQRMGQAGYDRARARYDLSDHVAGMEAVYGAALQRASRSRSGSGSSP